MKETASSTHALSCGVPDRDNNEAEYLREALEMIDARARPSTRCKYHASNAAEYGAKHVKKWLQVKVG